MDDKASRKTGKSVIFNRKLALIIVAAMAGVASAMIALFLTSEDRTSGLTAVAPLVALAALLAGAAIFVFALSMGAAREMASPDPKTPYGDRLQRERRGRLFALPLSAFILGILGTIAVMDAVYFGEATDFNWWIRAGMILVVAITAPLTLAGSWHERRTPKLRRYLNDELSVAMRGKAWGVGYGVLMGGACLLYAIALFDPRLAMVLAPMTLAIGSVAPGLWFAILDRRADLDE
ncbi:hypothetical protein [Brevundimonas lutea]|uniref:hypothetical protein n=1 Tax=Brevundimonas lutea TaxID=2293980 RepID=UPI000F0289A1|nr:hypothetical protein [Brevundimonas lutea]